MKTSNKWFETDTDHADSTDLPVFFIDLLHTQVDPNHGHLDRGLVGLGKNNKNKFYQDSVVLTVARCVACSGDSAMYACFSICTANDQPESNSVSKYQSISHNHAPCSSYAVLPLVTLSRDDFMQLMPHGFPKVQTNPVPHHICIGRRHGVAEEGE